MPLGGSFTLVHSSTFRQVISLWLCLRLRILPEVTSKPIVCNCGVSSLTDGEFIDHALLCDHAARFGRVHRHGEVQRALVMVARAYNILSTIEPGFYTYESGKLNRPDITFYVRPPLAIDVSIVSPDFEVDVAASRAAREKVTKHSKAVEGFGHAFLPFVMEVYGHQHESCSQVYSRLSYELEPATRSGFVRDMKNAVSAALARGRVKTLVSAIALQRASFATLSLLRN